MNPAPPAPASGGNRYDAVPYESVPFAQTLPERMAVLAQLFGLQSPAPQQARVLELGCADGGNLIAMAVARPEARFVGIDLSPVQVAQGQALIGALGLSNITLHAMSILDVDEALGRFDYVIAHGVYSWVPDAVQARILAICASQLTETGIGYVSYNTLPGWRMRGMVRDLMRYHASGFGTPQQQVGQARAIVDFLARAVPDAQGAWGRLLRDELETLRQAPDHYILHEHLEEINEPLYFHQFVERAVVQGLQYLAEAELASMLDAGLPPAVAGTLREIASDLVRQEQFMDFLRNRSFRQTLLVHAGRPIQRRIRPQALERLWISGALNPASLSPDLRGDREESFRTASGGVLRTRQPVTKAAAVVLARQAPLPMAFDALLEAAASLAGIALSARPASGPSAREVLASDLLQCHLSGLVDLHGAPPAFTLSAGERPRASALARWQAARGHRFLTTLRHEPIGYDAPMGHLLQLMDGQRDRAALAQAAAAHTPADTLDARIDAIARAGLLHA